MLVHGAGSGPWVFDGWPGRAVDLHAGLNVAAASMLNYEAIVARAAERAPRPLALVGWSMGGLAAMLAARRVEPDRLVLLEPSPPGEVQGFRAEPALEEGTYNPEREYGPFPPDVAARPESAFARAERKRGVSVSDLPFPTLVVSGDAFPDERGRAVAERYGAEELRLSGIDHWGLVRAADARDAVLARLSV